MQLHHFNSNSTHVCTVVCKLILADQAVSALYVRDLYRALQYCSISQNIHAQHVGCDLMHIVTAQLQS
jgi:hypothetical protein